MCFPPLNFGEPRPRDFSSPRAIPPPFSCHYLCYPLLRSLSPHHRVCGFFRKQRGRRGLPPSPSSESYGLLPGQLDRPEARGRQEKERLPFDVNRLSSSLLPLSTPDAWARRRGGLIADFFLEKTLPSVTFCHGPQSFLWLERQSFLQKKSLCCYCGGERLLGPPQKPILLLAVKWNPNEVRRRRRREKEKGGLIRRSANKCIARFLSLPPSPHCHRPKGKRERGEMAN